jgi:hypothetical protein
MTSAKYRAPANDAVENRAHLVTRLKFHRSWRFSPFESDSVTSSWSGRLGVMAVK